MSNTPSGLAFLALSALPMLLLSGCSYLFHGGVKGSYLSNSRSFVGYVTSRAERQYGEISIGTAEKMECQGRYEVSQKGLSVLGLALKKRIYEGEIFCLDGRAGSFELASRSKGETGTIHGTIGGEEFKAKLYRSVGKDCYDDYCRWGVKWTYERERENRAALEKVKATHREKEL